MPSTFLLKNADVRFAYEPYACVGPQQVDVYYETILRRGI